MITFLSPKSPLYHGSQRREISRDNVHRLIGALGGSAFLQSFTGSNVFFVLFCFFLVDQSINL